MTIKHIFFGLTFCFLFGICNAQTRQMDSLQKLLQATNQDSTRLQLYLKLADACDLKDNLKYAEPAVELVGKLLSVTKDTILITKLLNDRYTAVKLIVYFYRQSEGRKSQNIIKTYNKHVLVCKRYNNREGMTDALIAIADNYNNLGEPLKKLDCLKQGYSLMKQINSKKGESRFIMLLAFFYAEYGDTVQALNYTKKAESLELEIADSSRISRGYYLRARFYNDIKRYDQAISNYKIAENRYKLEKDTSQLLLIYYQIGNVYKNKNDLSKALFYYNICLNLAKSNRNNFEFISVSTIAIADIYALQGKYDDAIKNHQFVLSIFESFKFEAQVYFVTMHLANDYYLMKDFKKVILLANKLLALAYKSGSVPDILESEGLVYRTDSALGNFESAFLHYQKYLFYKNRINDEIIRRASIQEKFQNDLNEQKFEAEREQERKDLLSTEEKQKQNIIINSVVGVLLLVLIFSFILYKRFRLTNKQKQIIEAKNKEVETKNTEILDSIRYAKRIQTSLLPTEKYINRILTQKDKSKDA